MELQLLTAADTTNGAPASATAGFETQTQRSFSPRTHDRGWCVVKSTAGSGAMTVTLRLWGYIPTREDSDLLGWVVADVFEVVAADGVGLMNCAGTIDETSTDGINVAQRVDGLRLYSRLYAEVTAIAGTATAVNVFVITREGQ